MEPEYVAEGMECMDSGNGQEEMDMDGGNGREEMDGGNGQEEMDAVDGGMTGKKAVEKSTSAHTLHAMPVSSTFPGT